jgi:endonuclease/exonuclease/phosphatase family metal-dependent hydrolase
VPGDRSNDDDGTSIPNDGAASAGTDAPEPGAMRIAFWNTWLLAPRLWPSGPRVPGGERLFFAPDVEARAPLVGPALAGRFEVAALAEVFERSEHEAVARSWPGTTVVEGPPKGRRRTASSGLITLVDPARATVVRSARLAYRSGGDWRDADTFATKGALLTTVRPTEDGWPDLDVVSTHLLAGGDLLPVPGARDRARHHAARMRQVDELIAWLRVHRRPRNALLVVGDLNVVAHDPDPLLDDPTARYRDLVARFAALGLVDLWAQAGVGPGHTCTFDHAFDLPSDPDHPDRVIDHADEDEATAPGERLDYLFLAQPEGAIIDAGRPRRWAFHGRPARGGPAGSLSDHLALSVDLHLR